MGPRLLDKKVFVSSNAVPSCQLAPEGCYRVPSNDEERLHAACLWHPPHLSRLGLHIRLFDFDDARVICIRKRPSEEQGRMLFSTVQVSLICGPRAWLISIRNLLLTKESQVKNIFAWRWGACCRNSDQSGTVSSFDSQSTHHNGCSEPEGYD